MNDFWNPENWTFLQYNKNLGRLTSNILEDFHISVIFYKDRKTEAAVYFHYTNELHNCARVGRDLGLPLEGENPENYVIRCQLEIMEACREYWGAFPFDAILSTLDVESHFWSGESWEVDKTGCIKSARTKGLHFEIFPTGDGRRYLFYANFQPRHDTHPDFDWCADYTLEGREDIRAKANVLKEAFASTRQSLCNLQRVLRS